MKRNKQTHSDSIEGMQYVQKQLSNYKVNDLKELPVHIRRAIRKEKQRIDLAHVFGPDHKKDKDGRPLEQGLGSAQNQTRQSIKAFDKYHDMTTPENKAALERMEREFAECEKRRRIEAAAQEKAEQEEYELAKKEAAGLLGDDDE